MQKNKISRGKLALRLFLCAALFNSLLLLMVWPAESQVESPRVELKDHVEMKIRGQLHTNFETQKKVLLTHPALRETHEVILSAEDESGFVVWVSEETYRKHHRSLIQLEWAIAPYTKGLTSNRAKGSNYEIAY